MAKLHREPLVHFIILGALLFAGHVLWQAHVSKADYTITVTAEEMERQALIFAGETDLKSWFKANLDNFISPETRSFSHIYLSPEAHGDGLDAKAQIILAELGDNAQDWKALGDPFMMKREFKNINAVEAARLFGPNFSKGLFELDGTHWQGPIESAFGLHIIQLGNVTPEVIPEFQDVRATVESAWQQEAQRTINQNNLMDLIQKYNVVVEDPNEGSAE